MPEITLNSYPARTSGLARINLLHPAGTALLLGPFILIAALCLIASFAWPRIHDGPIMDYIAWRITSGAVPYRDIFDMNLPGTYLIHMVELWVFGRGDLGWRLFDLLWLALSTLAVYLFCRPISRLGGALAALFFLSYHLGQGARSMGQRDFLLCLFLVLAADLLARSIEGSAGYRYTFFSGVLAGFGASMKPHAALFAFFLLAVLVAYTIRRQGSRRWLRVTSFLAGCSLAPAAICIWLAAVGGLRPLVEIVTGYLLPYYPQLGGVGSTHLVWMLLKPNLFWILVVPLAWVRSQRGPRYALALLGAVYGVLHYALQQRGWWYHEYPFHLFLYILIGMFLAGLFSLADARRRTLALLCLVLAEYPLAADCYRAWRTPMSSELALDQKIALDRLVEYLRPRVDPNRDTVQTMDTAGGAVDALFILRVREATRYIYDFHLLYYGQEPFVRQMRSQFMSQLQASAPAYIVLFRESWPRGGYERFDSFPEFRQWLDRHYAKDFERWEFQVLRRRN